MKTGKITAKLRDAVPVCLMVNGEEVKRYKNIKLATTLLHEMAHLYNLVHGIQAVSNNGYYHNQKFKATAESHGLHIEKHAKYGWTVTTLAPEAEAWIRETLGEDKINASRLPVEGTTKGGSKKSINRSIKVSR